MLASAVALAISSGRDICEYATDIEEVLWNSLRSTTVVGMAACVLEGFTAPASGIRLAFGRSIAAPTDELLQWVFSRGWAHYGIHMPSGPFCLLLNRSEGARRLFGGVAPPFFARVALMNLRDVIWLATGVLGRLGHTLVWQEGPFTLQDPTHFDPETISEGRGVVVDLAEFIGHMHAVSLRIGVLTGQADDTPLEPSTINILANVREQIDAAVNSAGHRLPLLLAFSAANGSLKVDTDTDNSVGFVADRFATLCASTDDERVELRQKFESLQRIRRDIAHGGQPDPAVIDRFLGYQDQHGGVPGSTTVLAEWQRSMEARKLAFELLRRLMRALLAATMRIEDGRVGAHLTHQQLLQLVRRAQRSLGSADMELRAATSLPPFNPV
jgi:hypothetical protein